MKIESIVIYPIKGMKGVVLKEGNVLERGFANDRRYMLVDVDGQFVSQRTHPIIALFEVTLSEEVISVGFMADSYDFSNTTSGSELIEVQLFEHKLEATLVSKEADRWFSKMLKEPVQLVKMTTANQRVKKLIKGPPETEVSFADGYPYLILGTASLDELNKRLDDWGDVEIGGVKMTVVKPCARCQVVTIDQQTATKSKEPLSTLSGYRTRDHKVFFGANAVSRSNGVIRVGDELTCL